MKMNKRSFLDKIILVLSSITSLLLLLACIVPYTTSASFSFLSLGVPLLVICNLFFLMYWFVGKRKLLWISLIALIVGYVSLGSFIEFRFASAADDTNQLRVMSYNVFGFHGYGKSWDTDAHNSIADFIKSQNPDLISFQEYSPLIKKTEVMVDAYPYSFIDGGYAKNGTRVVQAIYSKFPIVNTGSLHFPESANHAIYADVLIDLDTIRLYNLHLESLSVRPGTFKRERSDKLFNRLRSSFSKQHEQALIFRNNADSCSYKKIVSGDFNNTQFSSAYRIIKGNMNDSFAEKGSGYGKTINFWRFPLRIDFILADNKFEILSHENYNLNLSDHEPVMASFKLSSDK